ncbi:MAG TPA: hypothetical protein VF746_08000 [Longimicrobium sp.]|jgi:hypothetical protein
MYPDRSTRPLAGRARLAALAAAAALLLAARPAAAQAPIPATITKEWVVEERLRSAEQAYDRFDEVKGRPDFARALMAVAEDARQPYLNRSNALLVLGATQQEEAFRFLERFFDALGPADPLRLTNLYALGSTRAPSPGVLQRLQRALERGDEEESLMAAHSLGRTRSEQARSILSARRRAEGRPAVREEIQRALEAMERSRP